MATITPGTGATISSTTAEGQALAALLYLQQRESNTVANPNAEDRISASFDTDLLTFAGQYQLPATQAINGSGQLVIAAGNYLNGGTFTAGTGGTFKSGTIEAYCLECLMYLQFLELQSAKNPSNRNYVTGTFNADNQIYSGGFSLPVSYSLGAGGAVSFVAVEYLLT